MSLQIVLSSLIVRGFLWKQLMLVYFVSTCFLQTIGLFQSIHTHHIWKMFHPSPIEGVQMSNEIIKLITFETSLPVWKVTAISSIGVYGFQLE